VPRREETALIQRAKEYDQAAWVEIYERYKHSIYNYIYYRVNETALAEDLTQEVFVRALESIDSFTPRGISISAWLYRMAHNLVADHYRRDRELPLDERLVVPDEGTGELAERRLAHVELRKALSRLTGDQQEVIILKFVDRLSNAKVAQIMGKTEGAIKSLQHRALASLRRALGEK